uniref:Uncharacterized protein n=1 Tax=Sipha flava TaxID=143950 RepID=A0A2S2Q933_9HEMI
MYSLTQYVNETLRRASYGKSSLHTHRMLRFSVLSHQCECTNCQLFDLLFLFGNFCFLWQISKSVQNQFVEFYVCFTLFQPLSTQVRSINGRFVDIQTSTVN